MTRWFTARAARRAAVSSSRKRAAAVSTHLLGVEAVQDPAHAHIFGFSYGESGYHFRLSIGTVELKKGVLQYVLDDFLVLSADSPATSEGNWVIRPPERSFLDYRDGMPGEAPNLVTPLGSSLVVPKGCSQDVLNNISRCIDRVPEGAHVTKWTAAHVAFRAKSPCTDDVVAGLVALMAAAKETLETGAKLCIEAST